ILEQGARCPRSEVSGAGQGSASTTAFASKFQLFSGASTPFISGAGAGTRRLTTAGVYLPCRRLSGDIRMEYQGAGVRPRRRAGGRRDVAEGAGDREVRALRAGRGG